MKRFISYLMVLSIILAGAAALADTAEAAPAEDTLKLSFSEVDRLVRRGNLTIRNNEITVQNIDELLGSDDMLAVMINNLNQLYSLQHQTELVRGQILATTTSLGDPVRDGVIMTLTNDIASLGTSIGQVSSQIDQLFTAPRASRDKTVQQLNNVNKQIVWGAESLFMGYHALARQLDQSKETLETLNRNINVLERRLLLGQITERTLKTLINNRIQLEQGIKSMENELMNMKGQINLLIGRSHDAPLEINSIPAAERDFLESIDRTKDLRSATRSNYLINIALVDVEEQVRKSGNSARSQEAIARNNYDAEVRAVELRYENLIKAITDRGTQLTLEEAQLSLVQQALAETRRKHDLGRVSRIELDQAESDVLLQTIRVKTAEAELFGAIRRYEWLIRGLSV